MSLELVDTPAAEEIVAVEEEPKEEPTPKEEESTETLSVDDIVSGKTTHQKGVDTTPKWLKSRIDELTGKIYEKDREIKELKEKRTVPTRPIIPVESDFADPQEYRQERAKYEDDTELWRSNQNQTIRIRETQERERTENAIKFTESSKRMREKYADFDEVTDRPFFTPEMRDEIRASDFGPEIGYFLAKNPGDALKLSGLSQTKLAKEIGRLEVKFSLATKKIISGAPAPINTLRGDDVVQKDPSKMTDDEWYKHDRQQKLKKMQTK